MNTFGKDVDFKAFKQIDDNYCGPACVEMLLSYFGLRPGSVKSKDLQKIIASYDMKARLGTEELTNKNPQQDQWGPWVTRPIEIVNMLHGIQDWLKEKKYSDTDKLSKLWINHFTEQADNIENFMKNLEEKLKDRDQPALIVPIHDGSHWVVLHKYTDEDGKISFIGKDPLIHSKVENMGQDITSLKGTITISRNRLNFSNPINLLMIMFTGGKDGIEIGNTNSRKGWTNVISPPPQPRSPQKILEPAEIFDRAKKELSASLGAKKASPVGRISLAANLNTPLLVKQASRPNNDYYLVTEKNAAGETTKMTRWDAQTGDILDSLVIEPTLLILGKNATGPTQGNLLVNVNLSLPKATNARVSANWSNALKDELNKTDSHGNNAPKLIWEPSRESESAFFPFYEVTANNETTYVRIDGTHFRKINPTSIPIPAPQKPPDI